MLKNMAQGNVNNGDLALSMIEPIINLENATKGLVPIQATLQELVNGTKKILSNDGKNVFTEAQLQYLENMVSNGENILNNKNATATDVQNAIYNFAQALRNPNLASEFINGLSSKSMPQYTQKSYNAFVSAADNYYNAGDNVLKNMAQGNVNNGDLALSMIEPIINLENAAVPATGVSKEALQNQIKAAQATLADGSANGNPGYTKGTTDAVNNAIDGANAVVNNPNATPEDVTNASNALTNAVNGLESNKDGLQTAINNAKGMVNDNSYTPASKEPLATAIASAEKVMGNAKATPAEVKAAETTINTAVGNLVKAATGVSKEALQNQIKAAQATLTDGSANGNPGYTKGTTDAVNNAIDGANAVVNNPNATPEDVTNASNA
ncbi:MAG: hypothetical protein ACRC2N_02695, partial [Aeromonas sp.]